MKLQNGLTDAVIGGGLVSASGVVADTAIGVGRGRLYGGQAAAVIGGGWVGKDGDLDMSYAVVYPSDIIIREIEAI